MATTPSPLATPSPPATGSQPPLSEASPPPQPSSTPPAASNIPPSPLPRPTGNSSDPPIPSTQSPPLPTPSAPPPENPSAPPPTTPLSPPPQPPPLLAPPPQSPILPPVTPLPESSPPPPVPNRSPQTPPSPQPTPPSDPPDGSSPPPPPTTPSDTPAGPSPPSPKPPPSSPPPPPASPPPLPSRPSRPPPPERSPPSPPSEPTENSPPPTPALVPPPPDPKPPVYSPPPPPDTINPSNAPPPPPRHTPIRPPPESTPLVPSLPPQSSRPPPPLILLAPPPPPPQVPAPGSNIPAVNNSSPNAPESSGSSDNNGLGTGALVGISAGVGIVILSIIVLFVWCLRRGKKQLSGVGDNYVMPSSMGSSPTSDSTLLKIQSTPLFGNSSGSDVYPPSEPGGLGHSKALFTYEELVKATNGFSSQSLLGEGGFGCVYKGLLPDGREVAVKQLKIGGGQGDREFKAEVETISRIHHRYLVSLVGYCISENQRLLIYEYVPNNNLYFHLHAEGRPSLDWAKRFKIAAGAARGIAYLHEDCHPRIIHRDIKSSNILLEDNFEARVSDFGLAKLALDANTHITTRVMGTFGYMAPEYASSGKLTEKSDVFSFGVVLLELITGRKPVDVSQPLGDESLVEWARPLLSHAIETEEFEAVADPRLGGNYVPAEMFRMIEAAAACVRHSAAKRPRMGQVVRAFDSLEEGDLTNGMKLGESEIFNSAQQSAEIRLFQRMAFGSQNYSTDFFTHSSWNSREEHV